jgi:hypothetical protein
MWWNEIAAGSGWGGCLLMFLGLVLAWAVVITAVPALFRPNRPSAGTATDPRRAAADRRYRPLGQESALESTSPDRGRLPS